MLSHLPAFIVYKDSAVLIREYLAVGHFTTADIAIQSASPEGLSLLDGLHPRDFAREPVREEKERLSRRSPLLLLRRLQERCREKQLHLFSALSYEAAHIFEDLELPQAPFCQFLVARAETLPTGELLQELSQRWPQHFGMNSRFITEAYQLISDTSGRFHESFMASHENLRVGDLFEIVLSRRFVFDNPNEQAYLHLASCIASLAAPYRFALPFSSQQLVGASPELLVHVQDGLVINRPISGSMRREATSPELTASERCKLEELYRSEKEKSELDMLVDLARHDLHRICSEVEVSRYREALVLETVVHTQSTVTGKLRPGYDALDAVFSCLNAGTLAGAPKKKAMEIIAQLEQEPRQFYGGNLVHTSPDGELKSTILIRTCQITPSSVILQGGATVLFESKEDYEYWECGTKVKGLLEFLGHAELAFTQGPPPPIDTKEHATDPEHAILRSYRELQPLSKAELPLSSPLRILLVDNHDSFTFNLVALFDHLLTNIEHTLTVVRNDVGMPKDDDFEVLVLSPGPSAPHEAGALLEITRRSHTRHPTFGVCLGFQAMIEAAGGELGIMPQPLHGKIRVVRCTRDHPILQDIPESFSVARYHSLYGSRVPECFEVICADEQGRPMAMVSRASDGRITGPLHCGLQFHPESFLSGKWGALITRNWLLNAMRPT